MRLEVGAVRRLVGEVLAALAMVSAMAGAVKAGAERSDVTVARQVPPTQVLGVATGAERLKTEGFARLAGKRVGLVTNQTGRIGNKHLIDLISRAKGVRLTAIFAPEHGFRGHAEAGETVGGSVDVRTGVPIHSLYGTARKPTPDMLRNVDLLIFDIQDIGARFYTYISTLGLAMQAAAEASIPFLVLDRPNPLGGEYVSGFVTEERYFSFIGQYPIPIVHGMTVGELARLIKGEQMLPGLARLKLDVVAMTGWERWMRWSDVERPWYPTSPNIESFEAAMVYPGTGLLEATSVSEGRGTKLPFRLVGADWVDSARLLAQLNDQRLPGVAFEAATFKPRPLKGKARHPRYEGRAIHGVRVVVTDNRSFQPVETGVVLLGALRDHAMEMHRPDPIDKADWLSKMAGTDRLRRMLQDGATGQAIIGSWQAEVEAFRERRKPYLLYR